MWIYNIYELLYAKRIVERKRERRDALRYVSDKDEKFERLRISLKCVGV